MVSQLEFQLKLPGRLVSLACFLMKTVFTSTVSLWELHISLNEPHIDLHELHTDIWILHQINIHGVFVIAS